MTEHLTLARALQPNDLVDLEPLLEWLRERRYDVTYSDLALVEAELAVVMEVHIEPPGNEDVLQDCLHYGRPEIAVICTDLGNWAAPADMRLKTAGSWAE